MKIGLGMFPHKGYKVFIAAILIAISVVAFGPKLRGPHSSSSCRSVHQEGISGFRRFTVDSSVGLDSQIDLEVDSVSTPRQIEATLGASRLRSANTICLVSPAPDRGLLRRLKCLLPRADSPDPLV